MAVIYCKLGGCLEVTAKLGPLARTDLWTGVKGLLERLMTHLGLGSSLEDPWGSLLGGSVEVVFLGDSTILLGSLGCPMPGRLPNALPDWPSLIAWLTCLGRTVTFPRGEVSSGLGRAASFTQGKVSNCLGRTASFPRGKESTRLTTCWGWIASFTGRKVSNCQGRVASFTWGKESATCWVWIASFPRRKVSNCQGRIAAFAGGKVSNCLGWTASFPRGKESACLTTSLV